MNGGDVALWWSRGGEGRRDNDKRRLYGEDFDRKWNKVLLRRRKGGFTILDTAGRDFIVVKEKEGTWWCADLSLVVRRIPTVVI